ncbi:hypothetical protein DL96DRAFT_1786217 [Flagelloscypha sp. PMI_526]|nr:hypothetical protein DL96DRAFT_1786217 [Flagelloscypha sp. PMI_526]
MLLLIKAGAPNPLDHSSGDYSSGHDATTAPIISRDVYKHPKFYSIAKDMQYSVFGRLYMSVNKGLFEQPDDSRLYLNTNAPFSALVCGVQGAGRSHTVSVLLEGMLIAGVPEIGCLKKPLSGLVFHYGDGGKSARPCEAAFLSQRSPFRAGIQTPRSVLFVSPTALSSMKNVYASLGSAVTIKPLLFSENELDAQSFRSLMAIGSTTGNIPLYMQIVLTILRELGENFTYRSFRDQLKVYEKNFSDTQIGPLKQRLILLESFIAPDSQTDRFDVGQLTIIDLSDPFIDPNLAASLFEIVVRLFIRTDLTTGKVLLVDEAHKYLSNSSQGNGLTRTLLRLIREQRHLGLRVIISTQAHRCPPSLIDLCSIAILHRFSALNWWTHISGHLSADFSESDAFDMIVKLKNGESIMLVPSGLGCLPQGNLRIPDVVQFGRRYLLVKTRQRVTADGGASLLVL